MESQYEGQPFVGANNATPPAPPFDLDATRRAAVNHIKRYQEVFSSISPTQKSESLTAVADPRGYGATTDQDTRVLRTIVKGKLKLDLNELLGSVFALEKTLAAKRNRVWITQGVIAAGLHLVLRTGVFTHSLWQWSWMCFAYYPIALYKIKKFENSISRTSRVREAFEGILESVDGERRLRQTDIDYVIGTEWDTVPWKELAGSIYFSQ